MQLAQTIVAAILAEAERPRPTFADVLASSLRPVAEMRAWFNEERGVAGPCPYTSTKLSNDCSQPFS